MKLKEFNTENTVSTRGGGTTPSIGIILKSGLFNLNQAACDLMGLKAGDQVVIHQDEEHVEDWYLEKVNSKGFVVRSKPQTQKGLLFNNTSIARQIAGSVEYNGSGGKLLIAGKATGFEKRKLWGLITIGLRNN